mmetsp:Transcript_23886/g.59757  ORF Transcript_23886/g.59757 Transcript_23886/m.59757 type:complete len:217 (-) Transcript_23886:486-1136(-)|eukprot:CAMPEP_0177636632 /NCGR_PEP_ID=MMETSP0447-20121125/4541_1 /TAXON_ID=0 /ORGANISM="Stygamoeba regulata, Strain BSH-02190019" /LENGTH=216 /DNA_ID=CAMNT_0019138505 /DNA_START=443 /DNA_END=1093 /DNA_ORIENTATION=+
MAQTESNVQVLYTHGLARKERLQFLSAVVDSLAAAVHNGAPTDLIEDFLTHEYIESIDGVLGHGYKGTGWIRTATLWDMIVDVSSESTDLDYRATVQRLGSSADLSAEDKFQLFVCYLLSMGVTFDWVSFLLRAEWYAQRWFEAWAVVRHPDSAPALHRTLGALQGLPRVRECARAIVQRLSQAAPEPTPTPAPAPTPVNLHVLTSLFTFWADQKP